MEPLQTIVFLLAMAAIVQFLVERIKDIMPEVIMRYIDPPIWSLALAIAAAFMFNLDVFAALGFEIATSWTILPKILTGLAISAGADPLHNLIAKLREGKE